MQNYPLFDKEYIRENKDFELHRYFGQYLHFTDNLVNQIQFLSQDRSEICLSFYPIAKNIRFPASYMTQNILLGRSSYIDNMARNGEPHFWKEYKQMGDWFPWLWARGRIPDHFKNIDGWKYYFNSFTDFALPNKISITENKPVCPPNELLQFFTYLSCTKYVFQLNDKYEKQMQHFMTKMEWPVNANILAVQIRRGETCTKDGSMTDRPFYNLDAYIASIEKMMIHNQYDYIYVSTDSDEEINKIQELRPEWKLLFLPIDRSQFFRMNEKPVDLEVFCSLEPERIPFIVDTGLADLYFISQCNGYISTISVSEFSRCGWFLQIATRGRLTPYINMNDEILDMTKRDKLLLL